MIKEQQKDKLLALHEGHNQNFRLVAPRLDALEAQVVTLLARSNANPYELIAKLLRIVKVNEWQYRHAAENRYCPFCATDDDLWEHQEKHHLGCELASVVAEAERVLGFH